nr:AEC family transporter [uncultured Blautia sp.]
MSLLQVILPVIIMLIIGMICREKKLIHPEGIEGLQALVMNFTLPISLFYTFYRASIKADTVIFPVTFFVVTAGRIFAGRLLCKLVKEKIAEKYNTTPEEVRREMQIAIDAGFDNPDPAVQEVFMGNLNPVIRKVNRM